MQIYFIQMEPKQPMYKQLVLQQPNGVEKRMWRVSKVVIGFVIFQFNISVVIFQFNISVVIFQFNFLLIFSQQSCFVSNVFVDFV